MQCTRRWRSGRPSKISGAGSLIWNVRLEFMTPLATAAFQGDIPTLRRLIAEGGDLDQTDHTGYSALTYAACAGQTQAALTLLDAGADPAVRESNDTFHTPLTIAAFNGHFEMVKLL